MKNKKNSSSMRSMQSGRGSSQEFGTEQYDAGDESSGSDTEQEESTEANYQAAGSRQLSSRQGAETSQNSRKGQSGEKDRGETAEDFDPRQLLDTAREFVEGHPGRATLIGAAIGGVVAGLFATERGRQLARAAYSYSRPMIADYARNFINSQSGDAVEHALPQ